jgi:hypothetical protein
MRTLLAVGVSAALLLGPSAPASAAKSHHRAVQNFRGANAAVVQPNLDAGTPPGYYYFPGYGVIPADLNRNLDPSTRGGG